jgi:hypothetical protein
VIFLLNSEVWSKRFPPKRVQAKIGPIQVKREQNLRLEQIEAIQTRGANFRVVCVDFFYFIKNPNLADRNFK